MDTGVYCWHNLKTGKRYVGSAARSFRYRNKNHLSELRRGRSPCTYLQHAWNKYGEQAFYFCILERCLPEECLAREQYWIDYYRSAESRYGYNCSSVAGSVLGCRWKRKTPKPPVSDETRCKLSVAGTGRKHTEIEKNKIAASMLGKLTGRVLTEEHKSKISWLGREHTEETKAKMSASHRGKVFSEATRLKMSESAKLRREREKIERSVEERELVPNFIA
mgnify:CR=1 FL=1